MIKFLGTLRIKPGPAGLEALTLPLCHAAAAPLTQLTGGVLTFSTDGDELDALARDEVESFVDVGDLVEPHLATVWKSFNR